ncbi:MAG: hypothetical protein CMJ76_16085 [Planctomycetaceae bacterium]|nr:hypothetical protein [Planctomycetaceae bacterium]|tara:strand:+ start:855 stop:1076 length:222 start_codon:yes stop_codon:yes gene_type:complete
MEKAISLLDGATHLYAAKGKNMLRLNLEEQIADEDTIARFMLGPTGNLRAPTMIINNIVLVGFNQELYDEVLG